MSRYVRLCQGGSQNLGHIDEIASWFALPIIIAFIITGIAGTQVILRMCMGRPVAISAVPEQVKSPVQFELFARNA
jgi:hypothetical protein